MAAGLFLSRVLGLLRDTAMTANFGVGLHADAYAIAFTIPDMLFMLIAGGGLSSAFIPVFSKYYFTGQAEKAWRLFGVVVSVCSLIVLGLIGLAWVFAKPIAAFMGRGKPHLSEILPETTHLAHILLPAQFAFLIGSLFLATLYARKRFLFPSVAPNVYNVGLIVGAILGGAMGYGIQSMALGGTIGAIVGSLLAPAFAMFRAGDRFPLSLDLKTEGVGEFFKLLAPVIFGFSLPSMAQLIAQHFASPYGDGMNAVVRLSNNLMQAPLGIFGQSLALAAFPALSQFFAQERMDLYRAQLDRTLRTVVFLSVPAAIYLGALAPELVRLLESYGHASHAAQIGEVALWLRVYSVGVVAWSLQPVLMRGYFSLHKTLEPLVISTALTGLFILLLWIQRPEGRIHLALADPSLSIPWSSNLAATLLAIALYVGLRRHVGSLDDRGFIGGLFKSLLAGLPMLGVLIAADRFVPEGAGKLVLLLVCGLGLLLGTSLYLAVAVRLGVKETEYVVRAFERIQKRVGA